MKGVSATSLFFYGSKVLTAAPIPQYDHHYSFNPENHLIRYVYHIERDRLFEDLFRKLSGC